MRTITLCFFISLVLVFSCNQGADQQSSVTGIDKLASQFFNININKDTVLKTLNGAILDIAKGSLSSSDSVVQLEIKEAYSLEEMIKARLTTQSNGQPLSSGGMLYINAAGGQQIKITKAIRVAVPTKFYNSKMQLYKGEQTADGINWTNPVPLSNNPLARQIETGEQLFKANCRSCHKVDVDFVGPALAHVIARKSREWVYSHHKTFPANTATTDSVGKMDERLAPDFITDSSTYLEPSDRFDLNMLYLANSPYYYMACMQQYFKTAATQMNHLKNSQLDSIYSYIQNETGRLQVPYPNNNYSSSVDSCKAYYAVLNKLLGKKAQFQKDSIIQKVKDFRPPAGTVPPVRSAPQTGTVPSAPAPAYPDNKVDPEETSSLYYQFNIDVVGWYNIDALLNTFDNKTETELRVRLIGTYKASLSVNLMVPVINTFLEGGKLNGNEGDYGFYTKDGKIPLPENAKAYIIVMGEADGQLLYAKKEFIVSKQQRIEIEAQPATTEEFNASIKAIGSANINIKATETQTGKDLKENEKQIQEAEKLKPTRCSCECGSLK